jgi:pimeloyl-ACP methyl ester carboxylesterase
MSVIYLHGFASSPQSGKATFLADRYRAEGIAFDAPDLNLPDFPTLTVTRMLEQTDALLDAADDPVTLIGSSLGAFVAVHAAAKHRDRVSLLVLMAPALDFSEEGLRGPDGADVDQWRRAGTIDVMHHSYGRLMPIHYELYADARRYDASAVSLPMPVIVFQGRRDTAVDPASVERWARGRPNVTLHMLDDDHQLSASREFIWSELYQQMPR